MGKQLARKGRTDDEAQKDATTDSCLGFGARQSKFAVCCVWRSTSVDFPYSAADGDDGEFLPAGT